MITVTQPDQGHLNKWRNLVAAFIRIDPDVHPEQLETAVANLAVEANRCYSSFDEGQMIVLTQEMMGVNLVLDEPARQALLEETGAVLLTGVDGPRATAVAMIEEIADIAAEERT